MPRYADREPLTPDEREGSEAQRERRYYYQNFRQAVGRSGAAYGVAKLDDGMLAVDCILDDGTTRRLGVWSDWSDAVKVQDYCVQRDVATKLALIQLYEYANYLPLEKLLEDAVAFGELPRRRVRLTLEVDVDMRGTDEEIASYVLFHTRAGSSVKAARVVKFDGPRLKEPKP